MRRELSAHLADYMLPAAFVVLEAFPRTPNGKLDRKALPAADGAALAVREFEPPLGDQEEAIALIWQNLLGIDKVGRSDHFFELGGHSLIVISMIEQLRLVGLEADVGTVFAAPVLSALAMAVRVVSDTPIVVAENGISTDSEFLTPAMLPLLDFSQDEIDTITASIDGGAQAIQDIYPLSALQEGLLFHHMLGGAGDAYLLRAALEFDGRARLNEFLDALQIVVGRHDILRSAMRWNGCRTRFKSYCGKQICRVLNTLHVAMNRLLNYLMPPIRAM